MSNPALSNLKDIHLPNPVGLWPIASGWYILLLFILLLFFIIYRFYSKRKIKRLALKKLKLQKNNYLNSVTNNKEAALNIAEILKRVALAYFKRDEIAHLHGEAWLIFLEKSSNYKLNFSEVKEQLLDWPYRPDCQGDLTPLFKKAKIWIKTCRGKNV